MRLLFFSLFICQISFGQDGINITGKITDSQGQGIPFVNLTSNNWYGNISDSLGAYKLFVRSTDKIRFSSVGFEPLLLSGVELISNSQVFLTRKIIELDTLVIRSNNHISNLPYPRKVSKMGYEYNYNFEEGVLITNNDLKGQVIDTVYLSCGIKGNPKLPYRLNLYSVDMNGIPVTLLNKKQVIITPKENLQIMKIYLGNQKIKFPNNGIVISLELLNPSTTKKKLGKNYMPFVGFDKKSNNTRIIRTDYIPNWGKAKNKGYSMAVGIDFLQNP